jgi:Family of unknown function (DUF5991)
MQRQIILSLLGAVVGLALNPIDTLACRSPISTVNPPKLTQTQRTIDLTPWQGNYNFIESREGEAATIYMNYDIRISLARCGWRSFVTVNGHLTALDLQTEVRAIDDNTIGLYYQQNIVPSLQPDRFQRGDLLLRIHRESPPIPKPIQPLPTDAPIYIAPPPIYRVYFDALTSLIPAHQTTGLPIDPPQPLNRPSLTP